MKFMSSDTILENLILIYELSLLLGTLCCGKSNHSVYLIVPSMKLDKCPCNSDSDLLEIPY